jgi:hypothetical protein
VIALLYVIRVDSPFVGLIVVGEMLEIVKPVVCAKAMIPPRTSEMPTSRLAHIQRGRCVVMSPPSDGAAVTVRIWFPGLGMTMGF